MGVKFDRATFFAIAQTLVPQLLQFTPLAPISNVVRDGIIEAEGIKGTGQEKLSHVVQLGRLAVAGLNEQKGRVVIDPVAVDRALASGISTAVDIVNLIAARHGAEMPAAHIEQLKADRPALLLEVADAASEGDAAGSSSALASTAGPSLAGAASSGSGSPVTGQGSTESGGRGDIASSAPFPGTAPAGSTVGAGEGGK